MRKSTRGDMFYLDGQRAKLYTCQTPVNYERPSEAFESKSKQKNKLGNEGAQDTSEDESKTGRNKEGRTENGTRREHRMGGCRYEARILRRDEHLG